jgi:uncharacterized protein YdaU (DUF1376 family)
MEKDLPQPFVSNDIDLRTSTWMRLDINRLLDSDLYALSSGEEFKAALTLWCKSWHQVPAGSLPEDDRVLAHLAGVSASKWSKLRDMAMKNWVLCSDNRYYHPVVTEQASAAWMLIDSSRQKKTDANTRKAEERAFRSSAFRELKEKGIALPWHTGTQELRRIYDANKGQQPLHLSMMTDRQKAMAALDGGNNGGANLSLVGGGQRAQQKSAAMGQQTDGYAVVGSNVVITQFGQSAEPAQAMMASQAAVSQIPIPSSEPEQIVLPEPLPDQVTKEATEGAASSSVSASGSAASSQQTLFGTQEIEVAPAAPKKRGRPKAKTGEAAANSNQKTPVSLVWDAYSIAYEARYGVPPVYNAKVFGMLAQFVKRLPVEVAPQVAASYLGNNAFTYTRCGHGVGMMLQDAEKLHTEYMTGRRITDEAARKTDKGNSNVDLLNQILAERHGQEVRR